MAAVTAPDILNPTLSVGKDMVKQSYCNLEAVPPAPVDVTIEAEDDSVASVSIYEGDSGSKSITFTDIKTTGYLYFWVQGRKLGTTHITISTPGYTPHVMTVTVDPSGFVVSSSTSISVPSTSPGTAITIKPARLNPTTFRYAAYGKLRGGISDVPVEVVSSDWSVGTISTSPLMFLANASSMVATLVPKNVGTCTISVVAPAGFSIPSEHGEVAVTVTP